MNRYRVSTKMGFIPVQADTFTIIEYNDILYFYVVDGANNANVVASFRDWDFVEKVVDG